MSQGREKILQTEIDLTKFRPHLNATLYASDRYPRKHCLCKSRLCLSLFPSIYLQLLNRGCIKYGQSDFLTRFQRFDVLPQIPANHN